MPFTDDIDFSAIGESIRCILSNQLQKPIPLNSARLWVCYDQRFVNQMSKQVQHFGLVDQLGAAHRLSRLERPSAREDGQPSQEYSLGLGEQLVAPIKSPKKRLMTQRCCAATAGQQLKRLREPLCDSFDAKQFHQSRRQFDSKRHTVQPSADLSHRSGVPLCNYKFGRHCTGPLCKKENRLCLGQIM